MHTCNMCLLRYVWERVQKSNQMFKWNTTGFNIPSQHEICCILWDYWNERTFRNVLDASTASRSKQCEKKDAEAEDRIYLKWLAAKWI